MPPKRLRPKNGFWKPSPGKIFCHSKTICFRIKWITLWKALDNIVDICYILGGFVPDEEEKMKCFHPELFK